jgi:hypothetical protein
MPTAIANGTPNRPNPIGRELKPIHFVVLREFYKSIRINDLRQKESPLKDIP